VHSTDGETWLPLATQAHFALFVPVQPMAEATIDLDLQVQCLADCQAWAELLEEVSPWRQVTWST